MVLALPVCMALLTLSNTAMLRRVALACVAVLMPIGIASAQTAHTVRVNDEASVRSYQDASSEVVMIAEPGMLLEVIHTEGDRFVHRKNNWYWVLLPRDAWGTQRAGWISGRQVEVVARADAKPAMGISTAAVREAPEAVVKATGGSMTVAYEPMAPSAPAAAAPAPAEKPLTDVVLNFDFAKSNLTDAAVAKLSTAISQLKPNAPISFAVEGHADAIGSEKFNKRLGLERAETVKRYLAEHQIPAEQIGVISFGEDKPAASNATEEGRAENRRVVIKVGR